MSGALIIFLLCLVALASGGSATEDAYYQKSLDDDKEQNT